MALLQETLLSAWLNLSANLWNERIVQGLSYNESVICALLAARRRSGDTEPWLTARDLCRKTKLLKSQMNKTLTDLEGRGLICRRRSETDRRMICVELTDAGLAQYLKEHRHILSVVEHITERLGPEKSSQMAALMNETAAIMEELEGTL